MTDDFNKKEVGLEEAVKRVEKAVDNLAIITARGFEQTATKDDIKALEQRMNSLEQRIEALEQRMNSLEDRMETLEDEVRHLRNSVLGMAGDYVPEREVEDLEGRVGYIEKKLGIESGK